jgi:hypothetical protein
MADTGLQSDDSPQSYVVRLWQEPQGEVRGTVRHVQSQSQRGFTRFSQAQQFMEQNLPQQLPQPAPAPVVAKAPARPKVQWSRRRTLALVSGLIVAAAALTIVLAASLREPEPPLFGSAVATGPSQSGEILAALVIGLVIGATGSALWFRRRH